MTDWRNLSQKANKLTLESAGGYLVCVEGGKTNTNPTHITTNFD
jgi:hypothetical protein